jgi:hypothetical protein
VLAASAEHDLPVDDGELMLLVARRLEAAGLDQRKLPRSLLPGTALTMTQTAAVRLWLVSDRAQILFLVWDASPQSPVRADASDESENGRGLMLVEAISAVGLVLLRRRGREVRLGHHQAR